MSDKSPLFVSALELIAHATELFAQNSPKKHKFIILHLANAIELILKDCMIDQGISIYEQRTNRTVGIWDCISKLKDRGIGISELPIIELLIDDRNTIQHRFGQPSAESVVYYVEQVVDFFGRFLNDHYSVSLAEALEPHLSTEHLGLLGLVKGDYEYLDRLERISPEASVVQAFNIIQHEVDKIVETKVSGYKIFQHRNQNLHALLKELQEKNYLPADIMSRFDMLRETRNYAAHSADVDTSNLDWRSVLGTAKEIISALRKARVDGYEFLAGQVDEEAH